MKNISLFLLISTLFLVLFTGGSSELWPLALPGVLSLAATVLFLLGACLQRYNFIEVVGAVPLFLVLLFPLLQLISLPPLVVEAISPATYELYEPLLQLSATERWIPLSVAPKVTLLEFFQLVGYACTYILTAQLLSSPFLLKKSVTYLVVFGAGLALWSILQRIFSQSDTSGRFVAFLLLTCPLAFSLFFYYRPLFYRDEGWRGKVALLFAEPGLYRHYYFGCSGVLMAVAALGGLCWGNIFLLLLFFLAFLLLYNVSFPSSGRNLLVVALMLVFVWFGRDNLMPIITGILGGSCERVSGQVDIWQRCFEIMKQFPLLGTGLGSFEAMYSYTSFPGGGFVPDHLQIGNPMLPVEMGAVGTMLGVWFLLTIMWHVWKKIQVRGDRFVVLLGIGTLSGIVLFLAHSFWLFNPYGRLEGFHLFFFLGLLVAVVNCRFTYHHPGTLLDVVSPAPRCVFATIAVALLCISLLFHGGSWYARSLQNAVIFSANSASLSAVQRKVEKETMLQAVTFDPLESVYSSQLAQLEFDAGNDGEGMRHLLTAGFKNVMKGEVYQKIGFMGQGSVEQKTRLIEMGYRRVPHMEQPAQIYVQWLFDNGKRAEALEVMGERLKFNYRVAVGWMTLVTENRVTQGELRQLLPRSVDAWLYLGSYSEANSSWADSDFYYGGALILISEAGPIDPDWFITIINYYQKNQRSDMVVLCIRRAITLLPTVGVFHRLLGDYYFKKGVMYRAKEEYEQALLLDPKDIQARRQLQEL